jgi:hypothetical protein
MNDAGQRWPDLRESLFKPAYERDLNLMKTTMRKSAMKTMVDPVSKIDTRRTTATPVTPSHVLRQSRIKVATSVTNTTGTEPSALELAINTSPNSRTDQLMKQAGLPNQ